MSRNQCDKEREKQVRVYDNRGAEFTRISITSQTGVRLAKELSEMSRKRERKIFKRVSRYAFTFSQRL